jgi:HPt (histidine-containing phosphotransfer) domain-containing protein
VRRLAHSLKGSSGSIGAVGLSELAAKLEYAARAAALHEVDATLDALGRAAQETERALRRAGWLS